MLRQLIVCAICSFAVLVTSSQAPANPGTKGIFTKNTIVIDGKMEENWKKTPSVPINMYAPSTSTNGQIVNKADATFQSIWDGASLFLFIQVRDEDVSTSSARISERDGVEVYLDLWNDKYPKYEEDDGLLQISANGARVSGGTDTSRFGSSVVSKWTDKDGKEIGYQVELGIYIGGLPQINGTRIGLEIAVNDIDKSTNKLRTKIYWANAKNRGLDDNSIWGTIVLSGYDGKSKKAVDDYSLKTNIDKAESMVSGIWQDEKNFEIRLEEARIALEEKSQPLIDKSNAALVNAMKNLRRKGAFPDPKDLPTQNSLPDPFKFQNGAMVKSASDWEKRGEEIKALAQYYEYGKMPVKPQKVTAQLEGEKLKIQIENDGKTSQFEAMLTLPKDTETDRKSPYPVIVSIDFFSAKPNPVYLKAGYAVLSMRYTSVGSDNFEHKGAFYELYPYDITIGQDAGTLLAWAWGASRCVDALEYLMNQKDETAKNLDLTRLVVTGFSRCGKAALAAGLFDKRFGLVSPGASGCGGAAVFRYVSFGNRPFSKAPYGHQYAWGTSPGCEVMPDKIRHQGHNSNEMLMRFLNPPRIYQTKTYGYGERLPYDHHEIIAAIAPRAVLITTATDDYSNNAEGDAIGYEAAKKVYDFLGLTPKIGLNIRTTGEANPRGFGGGHWISDKQISNLVEFADFIFYQKPLSANTKAGVYTNPYLPTFDKYFGGLRSMMPWAKKN